MSVSIIRGTNDKPAASGELASTMEGCRDLSGQLFIGYPIVATPEGRHRIDALLVSPERGLVVFDLVEGAALDGYQARQDDSANRLEARLRTHRELTQGRNLAIPIHTLSFAPGARVPDTETDGGLRLPGCDGKIPEKVCRCGGHVPIRGSWRASRPAAAIRPVPGGSGTLGTCASNVSNETRRG